MTNISLEIEQQQRVQSDLAVVQNQKQEEAELNTDSYSVGYLEGYWGCKPSQVGNHSYWAGYQIGCREYWAKKLGVVIPTEF